MSFMFPPPSLPLPGEILLITDELASPADFLLHRSLSTHLKESKLSYAIILSVSESLARWKAVAGRSVGRIPSPLALNADYRCSKGVNLAQLLSSGALTLLEYTSEEPFAMPDAGADPGVPLKALLGRLRDTLVQRRGGETPEARTLVILEDIAALEWIGTPLLDLSRFARALCATCRQFNAALIVRHHVVTPGEPDDLLRLLMQLCTYHMDVLPLSSGRSGAVSGQVALHAGPSAIDPPFRLISRSDAVHYRLTDAGSVFFDRGTGGGVL
ncbi:uncharacterized protein FIBRA_06049 [Fibroporia radiculosa]|uniref:Elongator complex protein 6 n=1 Tax=Fibroporia radiculosa TaxID=599839 RepID=J4GAK7_9APHY|nr:uncharacterized protein FIBRA_06049 [Fibroporia radiculosa]CCM03898.1 predicted protein [Fibroporia radiculosa]